MSLQCPQCHAHNRSPDGSRTIRKFGHFWRKSDGKRVQRFSCVRCGKHFSHATFSDCYLQKKRHKNLPIFRCLTGGVSQRETAYISRVNRKTVARRVIFWGIKARKLAEELNRLYPRAREIEFDDMESFIHTKYKPVAITLMTESKSRRILGVEVSRIPPKSGLKARAEKKYGPRPNEKRQGRERLFARVCELVDPCARIRSDSDPHYRSSVRKFFPRASYEQVISRRAAVTGQGELKVGGFDPLFSLNHTAAMYRDHVKTLARRTWTTAKRMDRFKDLLDMYLWAHNDRLRN